MKGIWGLATLLVILFTGCKKEYDLSIIQQNQKLLVVEGILTNELSSQTVKLTRTINYLSNTTPEGVTNATVYITSSNDSIPYKLLSPGIYISKTPFKGEVGETYTLHVIVDSMKYTASSVMHEPQYFNSIRSKKDFYSSTQFQILGSFDENPEKGGHLYLNYYINKGSYCSIYKWATICDNLFNGQSFNEYLLFSKVQGKQGDTITVNIFSISKEFYDFINSAQESLADPLPFSAPPGTNICGNISDGAIGYFEACSVTKVTTVLTY